MKKGLIAIFLVAFIGSVFVGCKSEVAKLSLGESQEFGIKEVYYDLIKTLRLGEEWKNGRIYCTYLLLDGKRYAEVGISQKTPVLLTLDGLCPKGPYYLEGRNELGYHNSLEDYLFKLSSNKTFLYVYHSPLGAGGSTEGWSYENTTGKQDFALVFTLWAEETRYYGNLIFQLYDEGISVTNLVGDTIGMGLVEKNELQYAPFIEELPSEKKLYGWEEYRFVISGDPGLIGYKAEFYISIN